MNSIGAALTCQTPPRQFTDLLKQGQSKLHSITIGAATKTLQITLTWASPLDKFKLNGLRLVGKQGLLAVASRKPGKLKVTKTTSTTFTVAQSLGAEERHAALQRQGGEGRLRRPKATLTTQVGQSTHK